MPVLSENALLFQELMHEVVSINRLLQEGGAALTKPSGLSVARWQVLRVLKTGDYSVATIARLLGQARQGIQKTADSLCEKGLTVYLPNPNHSRSPLLRLTSEGKAALSEVEQQHTDCANHLTIHYKPVELQATLDVLRQLRQSLTPGSSEGDKP